jgi:hypothetical protein
MEEYLCSAPSETALAEVAANAYVRIIECSRRLNSVLHLEYLSSEKNGYYSLLSKELDRAERHFQSAIMAIKTVKSPPLTVRVTAQSAFIADKQQINSIIAPKKETNDSE